MKFFLVTLISLISQLSVAQSAFFSVPLADFEPNNSIESAEALEFGREVEGSIASSTDVDYYTFSVDERVKLSISFSSEKQEQYGWHYELLSGDGTVLGASVCSWSDCVEGEVLSAGILSGTYYLKVSPENDSSNSYLPDGAYSVTISRSADSAGIEFETNNTTDEAQPLSLNQSYEGQLSSMSDVDYYAFSVDERVKLSINFSSEKQEQYGWRYELLSGDGTVLGASVCSWSDCVEGEVLSTGIQVGNYYLRVIPEYDAISASSYLPDGAYYFLVEFGDKDDDGVLDEDDNCLKTANSDQLDTDGDGFGNVCDDDDDNDGVLDESDAFPLDAGEAADSDSDGIGNNADTDDDNDGLLDTDEAALGTNPSLKDSDGDGVEDGVDLFPLDGAESVDLDGDSIGDNEDTDDDGDGQSDADEISCGSDSQDAESQALDTDGDGIPDCTDVDDDDDGQSDEDEALCGSDPLDSASLSLDTDSDQSPDCSDSDDDNDGVSDELDFYPLDGNRTQYGGQRALIVAGGGPYPGNFLWTATKNMANVAYESLKTQGLTDDSIEYLSAEQSTVVDGVPTVENIKQAVRKLGQSEGQTITDVLVYLVDHGDDGVFKLDETTFLSASDLKTWLDGLHAEHDVRSTLVYDACQAGSFVPILKSDDGSDRLVIASSSAGQNAWFANRGYLSFSFYFWSIFRSGGSFGDASVIAKNAMKYQFSQLAMVDSNSNGIADEKEDKLMINDFSFGRGAVQASEFPIVGQITVPPELNGETQLEVSVSSVGGGTSIETVTALLTTPDKPLLTPEQPLVDPLQTELSQGDDGTWGGTVLGFEAKGVYEISIVAQSKSGLLSYATDDSPNTVTVVQRVGREPIVEIDTDGDGIKNAEDDDDDGDGVVDTLDAFPLDASESKDADSDGVGNNTDADDDNDGILDEVELSLGTDPIDRDSDDDGSDDGQDDFPLDPTEFLDTDGDGIGNNADDDDDGDLLSDEFELNTLGTNPILADTDADGVEDGFDTFPLNSLESADSDNDGVGDNSDAFPLDSSETFDSDLDGVGDNSDAFVDDSSETVDTDGDGLGNNADLDDDNDGFSDLEEIADGTDPLSRFSCRSGCFSFDVDENKEAKALSDGLLVIRYLFGFSGDSLTIGATTAEGARTSAEAISSYLSDADNELDIDGDGQSKALTDGLLLIRYLFGFSGDSLTAGALGEKAQRTSGEEIESYIRERSPGN